jgi:hypothetical protein
MNVGRNQQHPATLPKARKQYCNEMVPITSTSHFV